MLTIKILTGSVRPGRFNLQPARWVYEIAKKRADIAVDLLDLQTMNLPFLDERNSPSQHKYENSHTKRWAATIGEADGFVFVTPEYNHSISPVLKNAVDYLYAEWNYKPLAFVSYGSVAGGSRAVEHWRGIAAELKMFDLREQVMLPNYWERLNETGEYQWSAGETKSAEQMLDTLVFWAGVMQEARGKLGMKT